jgi:hypothetical protein
MKNFKQYITEVFSNTQIDVLKKEYESLSKIDPTSSSYKKLIKLLDSLPQDKLNQLANSNIKFISPLAKNRLIKVGDKIRTIKGGQIPGIVTKIEGTKVHFNHATDVYDTHFSGAKGKPKEYVVHISNIQKENKQIDERCWDGYKPTPGKKPYEKGSCMKENDKISEAASGPTRMELQKHFEKTPGSKAQKIASVEKTFRVKNIVLNSKQQIVNFDLNESHDDLQEESEHEGKKVTLNKPFRTPDGPKKFAVYVKNDKDNVVKVTFGDPDMEIKRDDPEKRKSYRARHNCSDPGPKWKANYWSCKMWSDKPVSKITESSTHKSFDFDILDGPRTKRKVGGSSSVKGDTPEDALKQKHARDGYQKLDVIKKDGLLIVKGYLSTSQVDYYYYRLSKVNV